MPAVRMGIAIQLDRSAALLVFGACSNTHRVDPAFEGLWVRAGVPSWIKRLIRRDRAGLVVHVNVHHAQVARQVVRQRHSEGARTAPAYRQLDTPFPDAPGDPDVVTALTRRDCDASGVGASLDSDVALIAEANGPIGATEALIGTAAVAVVDAWVGVDKLCGSSADCERPGWRGALAAASGEHRDGKAAERTNNPH